MSDKNDPLAEEFEGTVVVRIDKKPGVVEVTYDLCQGNESCRCDVCTKA